MDLTGRMLTLYPFETGGAVLPATIDFNPIWQGFHQSLVAEMQKAGMQVCQPTPGYPDQGFVLRGQFVQVDPGSRWKRYFLTFFGGGQAVIEVEGMLYDGATPLMPVHALSKRNMGAFGGESANLLQWNARAAGGQVGNQLVQALRAH